jgi:pyruvate kinase
MEFDLHNRIKAMPAIVPVALAADTNGITIDTLGFDGLEYIINVGTAFVGGGFTVTIEQSPDDGNGSATGVWTAVPAAETLGDLPVVIITDADMVLRVGSIGKERHQRIVLTETGTISAGVIGVIAVLSHPREVPTIAQAT